jgi:hypothetical protein
VIDIDKFELLGRLSERNEKVPQWVEQLELVSGDTQSEKEKLKFLDAVAAIAQPKAPSGEGPLQTVADYLFPRVIEQSFPTSLQNFHVNFQLWPQLSFDQCNGEHFLPTNFNNSVRNGKADVGILLVSSDDSKPFQFPILLGELKCKIHFKERNPVKTELDDYLQLFNYMLTMQRPYRLKGGSLLMGFLMDYEEAYVYYLRVGYWTDSLIVPGTINSCFHIQLY